MLLKRCIQISRAAKTCVNWWHKCAMWEVANGKISVLLFTSWQIMKSYSSQKLTKSNLLCLCFIAKYDWWVEQMERDLREVIGN